MDIEMAVQMGVLPNDNDEPIVDSLNPIHPLEDQVGGNHYKGLKIQPVEFIHANDLGFLEGCIIKRICRYKQKDGAKDLLKIIHEVELLIAMEYPSG